MSAIEWPFSQQLSETVDTIRRNRVFDFIYHFTIATVQLWITSIAILWTSIFIYLMFYYTYIPQVSTTRDVFIQYDSTCDSISVANNCKIPFANIPLRHGRSGDFLRGQIYRFSIDLRLPESDVNWNQGLFMIRIKLMDQKQRIAVNVAKPTGLKYKSFPLRLIGTLLYWPLFVSGLADETQQITVNLIDDYIEGSHPKVGPITDAIIEFEARDVQIYPPTVLKVSASLTGLRYVMFYHWFISAIVGVLTISFFLYIITIISLSNYYRSSGTGNNQLKSDLNHDMNEDNDMSKELFKETNDLNEIQKNEITEESEDMTSGLTGDVTGLTDNESESEGSSTLVIQEMEDIDNQIEDLNPLPDSSMG